MAFSFDLPKLECGSCTACCHEPPFLDDSETTSHTTHEAWNSMRQVWQRRLAHGFDGRCNFVREGGCSIYSTRPAVCRRFDCREWYREHTRAQRRAHNHGEKAVFAAAKERGA